MVVQVSKRNRKALLSDNLWNYSKYRNHTFHVTCSIGGLHHFLFGFWNAELVLSEYVCTNQTFVANRQNQVKRPENYSDLLLALLTSFSNVRQLILQANSRYWKVSRAVSDILTLVNRSWWITLYGLSHCVFEIDNFAGSMFILSIMVKPVRFTNPVRVKRPSLRLGCKTP